MSEQRLVVRRWKVVSVVQTILLAFLVGIILYLLQYIRQGSTVTITPVLTSSTHATTLPNATSVPTLDLQGPASHDANAQTAFDRA